MKTTTLLASVGILAASAFGVSRVIAASPKASASPASEQSQGPGDAPKHGGFHRFCGPGGPVGPGGHFGGPNASGWRRGSHAGAQGGAFIGRELNLTDAQKQQVKAIMEANRPKIEAIQQEARAKIQAVMQEAQTQIRPILTPAQQQVLDDAKKLREDRQKLEADTKPTN